MVEPRLLAFSALLAGISSYLLFKRKNGSTRSRLNAEEARKEQERIKELLKYAEEMDEAYDEYLVGVREAAAAARAKRMDELERQEKKERLDKLERRKRTGKQGQVAILSLTGLKLLEVLDRRSSFTFPDVN
jgi:hypothetical protein